MREWQPELTKEKTKRQLYRKKPYTSPEFIELAKLLRAVWENTYVDPVFGEIVHWTPTRIGILLAAIPLRTWPEMFAYNNRGKKKDDDDTRSSTENNVYSKQSSGIRIHIYPFPQEYSLLNWAFGCPSKNGAYRFRAFDGKGKYKHKFCRFLLELGFFTDSSNCSYPNNEKESNPKLYENLKRLAYLFDKYVFHIDSNSSNSTLSIFQKYYEMGYNGTMEEPNGIAIPRLEYKETNKKYIYITASWQQQLGKIGLTGRTVKERIDDFKGPNPSKVYVLLIINGGFAVEHFLHRYMSKHCITREWFVLEEVIKLVNEITKNGKLRNLAILFNS